MEKLAKAKAHFAVLLYNVLLTSRKIFHSDKVHICLTYTDEIYIVHAFFRSSFLFFICI